MTATAKSCLIVDDDDVLRNRLGLAISARGYDVQTAGNADEALALAATSCPDLAVIDLKMPGMNGLELLTRLREKCATTRVVVLTGWIHHRAPTRWKGTHDLFSFSLICG